MESTRRPPRTGARAMARTAMTAQLSSIALEVVLARGYDATTVEDVCAVAGISRATFFRYFATKDDAILGDTVDAGEVLIEALRARPDAEAPWTALRRAFDPLLARYDQPVARQLVALVVSTPALASRHREKDARVAEQLRPEMARRMGLDPTDDTDPAASAMIGATFACVEAALAAWVSDDRPRQLADLLDRAMNTVEPPTPQP